MGEFLNWFFATFGYGVIFIGIGICFFFIRIPYPEPRLRGNESQSRYTSQHGVSNTTIDLFTREQWACLQKLLPISLLAAGVLCSGICWLTSILLPELDRGLAANGISLLALLLLFVFLGVKGKGKSKGKRRKANL